MNERVVRLSDTVKLLRTAGHPARAIILDALAALPFDRLSMLVEQRKLSEDDLRLVTEQTDHHPLAIADVLRRFVQFDCTDYSARFTQLLAECRSTGTTTAPAPNLGWQESDGLIRFLLHDIICCWNSRESRLAQGIVIEDNRRYLLARCYLIDRGLAFPTTIDLLRASCEQSWPNWQELWKYF